MGRNGAGKTTLLKMIAGASQPDSGSVRLGASLYMGYFAQQSLDVLDPDLTIIEQLRVIFPHDGLGSLRNLAGAFQFSGDDVEKKIARFPRRKVKAGDGLDAFITRPTFSCSTSHNHSRPSTKRCVEALKDFEGTMIFVSHDRMFLRGLGSRVLELAARAVLTGHSRYIPARMLNTCRRSAMNAGITFDQNECNGVDSLFLMVPGGGVEPQGPKPGEF